MDISQYETQTNHALLEIQRAQRVLDEAEIKMKRFKKQKQLTSKVSTVNSYMATPLPDIKEYLSYLINDGDQMRDRYERYERSSGKRVNKLEATTQLRNKRSQKNLNQEYELNNYKKTQKAERDSFMGKYQFSKQKYQTENDGFDLKKHTQQQLEKSQIMRLQRIQAYYKQNCETLDKKIQQLERNRQKIKKDKLLLMRNNQQLQQKIEMIRKKRQNNNINDHPHNTLINQLNKELSKLQKQLLKIEAQNNRIVKRKQDLQTNMRVCIRNNKQQLQGDLNLGLKGSKSKSMITKCPYH